MNRAQKIAWFGLVSSLICVGLMGLFGVFLLTGPTNEKYQLLRQLVIILSHIALLVCFLLSRTILRKNKNAAEPDIDERDRQVNKKAIMVTFVATWILMFLVTALPMCIFGLDNFIPVAALPLINVGVFLVILVIYNATILILYRMKGGAA